MYVYTYGNKKPIISIIGCIHGDEPSGKKIINRLKNYLLSFGNHQIKNPVVGI